MAPPTHRCASHYPWCKWIIKFHQPWGKRTNERNACITVLCQCKMSLGETRVDNLRKANTLARAVVQRRVVASIHEQKIRRKSFHDKRRECVDRLSPKGNSEDAMSCRSLRRNLPPLTTSPFRCFSLSSLERLAQPTSALRRPTDYKVHTC